MLCRNWRPQQQPYHPSQPHLRRNITHLIRSYITHTHTHNTSRPVLSVRYAARRTCVQQIKYIHTYVWVCVRRAPEEVIRNTLPPTHTCTIFIRIRRQRNTAKYWTKRNCLCRWNVIENACGYTRASLWLASRELSNELGEVGSAPTRILFYTYYYTILHSIPSYKFTNIHQLQSPNWEKTARVNVREGGYTNKYVSTHVLIYI